MQVRESHLSSYFSKPAPLPDEDFSVIGDALTAVQGKVAAGIGVEKKIRQRKLSEKHEESQAVIAAKHKLIVAKKDQEVLAGRLAYVSSMVTNLQEQVLNVPNQPRRHRASYSLRGRASPSLTPSAHTDVSAKPGISDYDGKRSESALSHIVMVRRLQREKEERKKKLRGYEELKGKLEKQREEERVKLEQEERARSKERMIEMLIKRRDSTFQRQEERAKLKSETDRRLRVVKNLKPLHELLEEQFQRKFIEPELRKIEEVLSVKRPSESLDGILQHAKETKEKEEELTRNKLENRAKRQQELLEWKRSTKLYQAKLSNLIQEEDRTAKLALLQKEETTKQLITRKQRYGEVIRELFKPTVSKLKQMEAEVQKIKAESPHLVRFTAKTPIRESLPLPLPKIPLRKKLISKSTEILSELTPSRPKDYLKDLRQQREANLSIQTNSHGHSRWQSLLESDDPQTLSEIKKSAKKLEILARSHEIDVDTSDWSIGVERREAISSLYLDSIRAKLAVLHKLSS